MYQLQSGPEAQAFDTRNEALAAAKALSLSSLKPVTVLSPDQREKVVYVNGSMDSYSYEPRGGKFDR